MGKKLQHINRPLTEEERQRFADIREAAQRDFPSQHSPRTTPEGIPAVIRAARESQGLTWYALAQLAGLPNQSTIRDIEQGKDVKLSDLQAVAKSLHLELELVPMEA